jgi:hypothetical protein
MTDLPRFARNDALPPRRGEGAHGFLENTLYDCLAELQVVPKSHPV